MYPEVFKEYSLFLENGEKNEVTVTHMDRKDTPTFLLLFCSFFVSLQFPRSLIHVAYFGGADCLDRLRQGVMCASNVGVQAWKKIAGVPDYDGAHFEEWISLDMAQTTTCRDFEAVQEWAFSRELKGTQIREHGQLGLKLPEGI